MNRGLQKEETKKRIQKAAISLFQQQGYFLITSKQKKKFFTTLELILQTVSPTN